MYIDYNLMKKSKDPYFELLSNNDIALYIDNLTFIGENGLSRFSTYVLNLTKNIDLTLLTLTLSEEDTFLLMEEKFKYYTVIHQYDNMMDEVTIKNKIIGNIKI